MSDTLNLTLPYFSNMRCMGYACLPGTSVCILLETPPFGSKKYTKFEFVAKEEMFWKNGTNVNLYMEISSSRRLKIAMDKVEKK